MYAISSKLYHQLATRLVELVADKGYYSGRLEFEFEGVWCELILSVFVYHQQQSDKWATRPAVVDMIPVWWEFHTSTDGDEMLNDMSFNELRDYIKSLL
ncbi:MAG: hypothetical protein IIY05_03245 [Alistipes sp.]|nr:hypothetical protein [Alistipes sp.]